MFKLTVGIGLFTILLEVGNFMPPEISEMDVPPGDDPTKLLYYLFYESESFENT